MDTRVYRISIGVVLLATGLGLGCAGDKSAEPPVVQQPAVPPLEEPMAPGVKAPPMPVAEVPVATGPCTYSYDPHATKLTWTSFKLTERVGVAGTFDKISAVGAKVAATPTAVFSELSFKIDTGSVNSQNPDRDKKLVASLFGSLADSVKISGKVTSIGEGGEGKGLVELRLGGVTKPLELAYTVSDDALLVATGKIDLSDYNGLAAVAALNKVCSEKHTGTDKVAKLWPDVELKIESQLKKVCTAEQPAAAH